MTYTRPGQNTTVKPQQPSIPTGAVEALRRLIVPLSPADLVLGAAELAIALGTSAVIERKRISDSLIGDDPCKNAGERAIAIEQFLFDVLGNDPKVKDILTHVFKTGDTGMGGDSRPWQFKLADLGGDKYKLERKGSGWFTRVEKDTILIDCKLSIVDAAQQILALLSTEDAFITYFKAAATNPVGRTFSEEEYKEAFKRALEQALGIASTLVETGLALVPGPGSTLALVIDSASKIKTFGDALGVGASMVLPHAALKTIAALAAITVVVGAGALKFTAAIGNKLVQIDLHHALPKFLGGWTTAQNPLFPLWNGIHKKFHSELYDRLRRVFGESMPKWGSSREKWEQFLAGIKGGQDKAFKEVLDLSRDFDKKYAKEIAEAVAEAERQGKVSGVGNSLAEHVLKMMDEGQYDPW